jgi:SAM-dependent methyltransferase
MSYKVYLFDALNSIEWSQVAWKTEGRKANVEGCNTELAQRVLLQYLPKEGLIVDAGCGVARWVIYLRRQGYRCFGLEYNHEACVISRENDPGIELLRSDVRNAPLKDGAVDAVISLGVVEHDENGPLDGLREAHRILKPNGLLVCAVPYNNFWRRLFVNRLQDYVTWRRRRGTWKLGFVEYRFSKREMRRYLGQLGFEEIATHPNDLIPPKNMGLWVDYNNLTLDPYYPIDPADLLQFPGIWGKLSGALVRWVPWLVCGEAIFVVRKKGPGAGAERE